MSCIKINGSWKSGTLYIKVNESWKAAKAVYIKDKNAWRLSQNK